MTFFTDKPTSPRVPKATRPGGGLGCLGCFGIILGFVVLVVLFAGCATANHSGSSSSTGNSYEAVAQCEARIGKLLKAPSTAKYDSDATGSGNGPWKVTGTVDAENSFGAMLRSS